MADGAGEHGSEVRRRVLNADRAEAELLTRFTAHPLFGAIDDLDRAAFLEVLLQRRFLSLLFPVVYDIGIDGLADEASTRLVRGILREEYPDPSGATPSHREDLVGDLLALGATREQIMGARPSAVTASVVQETLALMLDAAAAPGDAAVLTILRFWGEVLVSVEYGELWRRMEHELAAAGVTSRFYHPHTTTMAASRSRTRRTARRRIPAASGPASCGRSRRRAARHRSTRASSGRCSPGGCASTTSSAER